MALRRLLIATPKVIISPSPPCDLRPLQASPWNGAVSSTTVLSLFFCSFSLGDAMRSLYLPFLAISAKSFPHFFPTAKAPSPISAYTFLLLCGRPLRSTNFSYHQFVCVRSLVWRRIVGVAPPQSFFFYDLPPNDSCFFRVVCPLFLRRPVLVPHVTPHSRNILPQDFSFVSPPYGVSYMQDYPFLSPLRVMNRPGFGPVVSPAGDLC